ncbi:MAG TPA: N-acetylmuramoyl-L-alanine amidase [Gammaproteobacteria bacterium]|nr:N-acetylmuramoyl-L-alanine amidase [Gammaproteobacteria bacterium]
MRYAGTLLLALLCPAVLAAPIQVQGARIWPAPDNTRIVFDASGPVDYRLINYTHPERIEIELRNTQWKGRVPSFNPAHALLTKFTALPDRQGVRMVILLKEGVQAKSFVLPPNAQYGHRLVVDLLVTKQLLTAEKNTPAMAAETKRAVAAVPPRDIVIAIDAGHGGEDPGARGRNGTSEKDVVLAIARKLAALIKKEQGMRAVMIRDGDYFVSLRKRIDKARAHKADMFISIHADAFSSPEASGSSVYVLSERGATNEAARMLASRENAADLVGGVSLDDKDNLLASVLLDLSQTATIEASLDVGANVLDALKQLGEVHKRQVEQAGFVVLKSPDIPSILVETAYISNPREERNLRDPRHQQALAQAIMNGIYAYFAKHPPSGSMLAEQEDAPLQETGKPDAHQQADGLQKVSAPVAPVAGELLKADEPLAGPADDNSYGRASR